MAMAPYSSGSNKKARTTPAQKAANSYVRKTAKSVVIRMAEKKRHSVEVQERVLSTLVPGATADWIDLSTITDGIQRNARVGSEVTLTSVQLSGQVHNNAAGVKIVRFLVGYVTDQTAPTSLFELFDAETAGGTAAPTDNQNLVLYRKVNKVKFQVLHDRLIKLGGVNSADGTNTVVYKKSINLKMKKIHFEGVSEGTANQDKRLYAIMLCQKSNNDESTGSDIEWTQVSYLNYLDI